MARTPATQTKTANAAKVTRSQKKDPPDDLNVEVDKVAKPMAHGNDNASAAQSNGNETSAPKLKWNNDNKHDNDNGTDPPPNPKNGKSKAPTKQNPKAKDAPDTFHTTAEVEMEALDRKKKKRHKTHQSKKKDNDDNKLFFTDEEGEEDPNGVPELLMPDKGNDPDSSDSESEDKRDDGRSGLIPRHSNKDITFGNSYLT